MSEKGASFKLSRKAPCSIDSGRMGELSGLIWGGLVWWTATPPDINLPKPVNESHS